MTHLLNFLMIQNDLRAHIQTVFISLKIKCYIRYLFFEKMSFRRNFVSGLKLTAYHLQKIVSDRVTRRLFCSIEYLPNSIKSLPNYIHNFAKYCINSQENCHRLLIFCQTCEILPNLVTLVADHNSIEC